MIPSLFYRKNAILILLTTGLLAGCVRPQLEPEQFLVAGQRVKGTKAIETAELEALLPQKPNRVFVVQPFTPFLWVYLVSEKRFRQEQQPAYQRQLLQVQKDMAALRAQLDTTYAPVVQKQFDRLERRAARLRNAIDNGNWWMRVVGEPPSLITQENARTNDSLLQEYMRYSKGFFEARVSYSFDTTADKRARVTYTVTEGPPYLLNALHRRSPSRQVDSLLVSTLKASYLRKGQRYDESHFAAERERLEQLLRNRGYFGFSREDVRFSVDTSRSRFTADVRTELDSVPPRMQIGQVTFMADARDLRRRQNDIDTVYFRGVRYLFAGKHYTARLLDTKITVRPGMWYNQARQVETLRMLGTLDQFKFPSITYDTLQGHRLSALIYAQPLNRYELTTETGLNVYQGLPGPFWNGSLRIRNFLNGLDMLEIAGKLGYDGQPGFTRTSERLRFRDQNFEAGLNVSLIFPQLLVPGRLPFRYNNATPRTQVGLGYSFSDRTDFRRTGLRFAQSYSWQLNSRKTIFISPIDLNFINTDRRSADFNAYLDSLQSQGINLKYTFGRSFVSSISGSYVYSDVVFNTNQKARYWRLFLETGGTTLNFLSAKRQASLTDNQGIRYYKFIKISSDFRYYLPLASRGRSTLAFRSMLGYGNEYSQGGILPYEKAFFVGGANSMRGWRPRRLGLGSSATLLPNGLVNYQYEKPGDVLLELNAEWRFHMFKLYGDFNGALFVDAGNVYALHTADRQAAFGWDFWRKAGVNTGFGLRFDKSFFIIRADWGVRLYEPGLPSPDPQRPPGRWVFGQNFVRGSGYKPELRFGLGYPF